MALGETMAEYKVLNPNLNWNAPTSYKDEYWTGLEKQQESELGLIPGYLSSIRLHGEKSNLDQSPSSTGAFSPWQITEKTRQLAIKKWGIDPKISPENSAKVAGLLAKDDQVAAKGDPYIMAKMHHGGRDERNWGNITKAYANRVMAGLKKMSPIQDAMAAGLVPKNEQSQKSVFDSLGFDYDKAIKDLKAGKMPEDQQREFKAILDEKNIALPKQLAELPSKTPAPQKALDLYKSGDMPREDRITFENLVNSGELVIPDGYKMDKTEELGLGGKIADAFTGNDRETTQTKTLPSWRTMPELTKFDKYLVQQLLGASPAEIAKMMEINSPGVKIEQDTKGNYLFTSAENGQQYAVQPGMDFIDAASFTGQATAFGKAAKVGGVAKGALADMRVQAGIEAGKEYSGGNGSIGNVALAGTIGAATRGAGKVANVYSNRASLGSSTTTAMETLNPGVETVESIAKAAKSGDAERLAVAAKPDARIEQVSRDLGIAQPVPVGIMANDPAFQQANQAVTSRIGSEAGQQQAQYIDEAKQAFRSNIGASDDVSQLQYDLSQSTKAKSDAAIAAREAAKRDVEAVAKPEYEINPKRTTRYLDAKAATNSMTAEESKVYKLVTQHDEDIKNALKHDVQKTSDDLKEHVKKVIKDSEEVSNQLYKQIEDVIPLGTKVSTKPFDEYFSKSLSTKQNNVKQLTPLERHVMSRLKGEKDGAPQIVDSKGKPFSNPQSETTYDILKSVRQDLTEARVNFNSEFASTDKKIVGDLERLVDNVEKDLAKQYGVDNILYQARSEIAKRKVIERRFTKIFGDAKAEKNLMDKLKTAMSKLSTGSQDDISNILKVVPDNLREDVIRSGLTVMNANQLKALSKSSYLTQSERDFANQAVKSIKPNLARLDQAIALTKDEKLLALLKKDKLAEMHRLGVATRYTEAEKDISKIIGKDVSDITNKVVKVKSDLLKGETTSYKELMQGLDNTERIEVTKQILDKIVADKSLKKTYENLELLLNNNKSMVAIAQNVPRGTIKTLKNISELANKINKVQSIPGTQTGKLLDSIDLLNGFDSTLKYLTKTIASKHWLGKILGVAHIEAKTSSKFNNLLSSPELRNAIDNTIANGGSLTRRVSRLSRVRSIASDLYNTSSSNDIANAINVLAQSGKD